MRPERASLRRAVRARLACKWNPDGATTNVAAQPPNPAVGRAALGPVEVRSLKRQLATLRSRPSGRALTLKPAASCSSTLVGDAPLFLRPGGQQSLYDNFFVSPHFCG